MQLSLLKGYPDRIGKRFAFVGTAKGPTSYVQYANGGDVVGGLPYQNYIDWIPPVMSISGTYVVYFAPKAGVGQRITWVAKWVTISSGTEVTAAVNLSTESVQVGGYGGVY